MNITGKMTLVLVLAGITLNAYAGTVTRNVPLTTAITRVYLTGSAELHLTQGEDEFIKLTAPEQMVNRVEARVKGRSLYLGRMNKTGIGFDVMNSPIRFDVQLKRIDAIRIWGSASVWIGDLQADRLRLVMGGNGSFTARSLSAWEVKMALAGNCDFKADRVEAEESHIKVSGSGKINITELQTSRAYITIAGSGDLTFNALNADKVDTEVSGSANINLIKGSVDLQELTVAGSGDYRAGDLISNIAYIDVMGSGNVDVNVQKQLTAELSRGSDLVYHGNSELDVDISGEGKYRNAGVSRTEK